MKSRPFSNAVILALAVAQPALADLINVDFGASQRFPSHNKTGFAATGIAATDYWNFYSSDNPDGSWKVNGWLPNLGYAGGQLSGVGLTVYNGDGAWAYTTSDPMLYNYIYSLSSSQTVLAITNLSAGKYNFYLYGANSSFNLKVGNADYGTKVAYDSPTIDPPPWVEGNQYVLFSNVQIGDSQTAALISLGPSKYTPEGTIGGMQIELVPEPSFPALFCLGALSLGYRALQQTRAYGRRRTRSPASKATRRQRLSTGRRFPDIEYERGG